MIDNLQHDQRSVTAVIGIGTYPLMKKRRMLIGSLLVFALLMGMAVISKTPVWRSVLYDGMFDACRDGSLTRVRIWWLLGASPDGASDYEAGRGHNGFEFSSHIHTAAMNSDCRLLRFLISKRASPDLELGDGTSPLSMAVDGHKVEAMRILLEAGANPRYSDRWTAVDQARSLKFNDLIPIIQPYLKDKPR